jgi:hypothetical protein
MLPTGIVGTLANPLATARSLSRASADMLLRSVGILLMLGAFNWWLVVYGRAADLRDVADCMVVTAERCTTAGPPWLMWIGLAGLAAGLILQLRAWRQQGTLAASPGKPVE